MSNEIHFELTTPVDVRTTKGLVSGYICSRWEEPKTAEESRLNRRLDPKILFDVRTTDGKTLYGIDGNDIITVGEPNKNIIRIADIEVRDSTAAKRKMKELNEKLRALHLPWYKNVFDNLRNYKTRK